MDMNTKHHFITIVSSIALCACCTLEASSADPLPRLSYSLTDLGVLPDQPASIPAAINNQGQVAGTSGASAFRYTSTSKIPMEDVARHSTKGISRGFGINDSGLVVGDSTFGKDFSHAAVFSQGSATDLGTLTEGGNFSRANGINASGQVVGSSSKTLDGASSRAFIVSTASSSSAMTDLGTLGGAHAQALAINDSGFVTGNSQISQTNATVRPDVIHAFILQATGPGPEPPEVSLNPNRRKMLDLGTLGGDFSYGTAISSKNHVAGYSTINNFDDRVHAFLYDGEKMLDLGSLSGASLNLDLSYALGINSTDQVVGCSYLPSGDDLMNTPDGPWSVAFIYSEGVMRDLNDLIGDAATNYRLDCATAINDNGQIVAIAFNQSKNAFHAVLLTPRSR